MTVNLYSGTPGSGKSLNVTRKILSALSSGHDVISNYPIVFKPREIKRGFAARFFYVTEEYINVKNLAIFAKARGYIKKRKESQCLVIIDEAGGRFNVENDKDEVKAMKDFFSDDNKVGEVKEYGAKDRKQWRKFFSQHRKFGFDFILVAQSDRMLDRQIRSMIEKEYVHRKAGNMFWWFHLLPFKIFVCVEKYYGLSMKTDTEFFIYRKSLGNRYDSMRLFDGYDYNDTEESTIDCRAIFLPAQ